MKTAITKALIDDKALVCKLYNEFIDETHAFRPKDLEQNFETFIATPGCNIFIVYSESNPAGFIEIRELPNKMRDDQKIFEITSLFVREVYRKSNLGRMLVEYVKDYAKVRNATSIVLYSGLELHGAHHFYEKIGFRKKAFYFSVSL